MAKKQITHIKNFLILHVPYHESVTCLMISYFIFYPENKLVNTLTSMGDQQQYKINFSVPESLGSETVCFLAVHTT